MVPFPPCQPLTGLPDTSGQAAQNTHISQCLLAQYNHNSQCPAAPACPPALEHPHVPGAYRPRHTHTHPRGLHPQQTHTHPSAPSPGRDHWFLRTHPNARGLRHTPASRCPSAAGCPCPPPPAEAAATGTGRQHRGELRARGVQHRGQLRTSRASAPRTAPCPFPRGVGVPPGGGVRVCPVCPMCPQPPVCVPNPRERAPPGMCPPPFPPPGVCVSTPPSLFPPSPPAPVHPEPVVALEGLVPQQQIAEAVPGRQGQHLGLQLRHLQGGDVQNDPALAAPATVPAAAAAGRRQPAGEKGAEAMGGEGRGERPALPCPPPPPAPAPAPPPGPAPRNPHPATHRPALPRTAAPRPGRGWQPAGRNYIAGQAAVPPLQRAPPGGMGGEGLCRPQARGRRGGQGAERGPPERPAARCAGQRCAQDICSSAGKQQRARGANGKAQSPGGNKTARKIDLQLTTKPRSTPSAPPPQRKVWMGGRQGSVSCHNRAGSRSTTSSLDCWHLNYLNIPSIK